MPKTKPKVEKQKPLPDEWRREIQDLIREEITSMMQGRTVSTFQTLGVELPPEAPVVVNEKTKRKKAAGQKTKIAGIIDARLEKIFSDWAKEHDLSISRGLETMIWTYFGKPKLSFETSEGSENVEATED